MPLPRLGSLPPPTLAEVRPPKTTNAFLFPIKQPHNASLVIDNLLKNCMTRIRRDSGLGSSK